MKLVNKFSLLITSIMLLNLYACNTFASTPNVTQPPVLPTSTRQASIPTSTILPIAITPSPLPTQPIIFAITPDAIQVERWREYQTELAKSFLSYLSSKEVICEWEILGRFEQEVYVWAVCTGTIGIGALEDPAVIHIEKDGSVQSVEIPRAGSLYASDIRRMFPLDAQEKYFGRLIHFQELENRLQWRRQYPEIPPLIISSAATPEPTLTEWLPYNPNLSDTGCDEFTATLPNKGTENLSQTDVAQKLFEIYLGHFKSPELGGRCRLEDFTVETVQEDKRIDFLANEQKVDYIRTVQYSIQIPEVPSDWVAGNGELAPDGWVIHKFLIIGITKVNDQYILKLIGTGP